MTDRLFKKHIIKSRFRLIHDHSSFSNSVITEDMIF